MAKEWENFNRNAPLFLRLVSIRSPSRGRNLRRGCCIMLPRPQGAGRQAGRTEGTPRSASTGILRPKRLMERGSKYRNVVSDVLADTIACFMAA
jgi:hypothetical protein